MESKRFPFAYFGIIADDLAESLMKSSPQLFAVVVGCFLLPEGDTVGEESCELQGSVMDSARQLTAIGIHSGDPAVANLRVNCPKSTQRARKLSPGRNRCVPGSDPTLSLLLHPPREKIPPVPFLYVLRKGKLNAAVRYLVRPVSLK